MGLIDLSLPWDKQPQAPAQATDVFDLVFLPPARADLASGQPVRFLGGASLGVGASGMSGTTSGGASDFIELASDSSALLSVTAATIIWQGRARVTGSTGEFGVSSGTSVERCGAHVPFTDNIVYWDFGGATSGTTRLTASGLTFADSDIWAFTTGPRGMEIWQNGQLRASNAATPSRTPGTAAFGIGRHAVTSGSDQVTAYAFAYSKRQLPSAFIAGATRDTASLWRVLLDPQRIGVPVSAGGGGNTYTFSAGGTFNLDGTANQIHTRVEQAGGSFTLTGTENLIRARVQQAAGGFVLSGDNTLLHTRLFSATGSVVFSGAAPLSTTAVYVFSAGGTVEFAGTVNAVHTKVLVATGEVLFTGNAGMIFIPAGGVAAEYLSRITVGMNRAGRLS